LIQFANADDEPGEFIYPIIKGVMLHFLLGYAEKRVVVDWVYPHIQDFRIF